MALTCPRCGTQNPDGNSFCQACGTPLAAAAAPMAPTGPPPGAPPPVLMGPPPDLPPPSYQSPFYAPGAGGLQAPVHRTPWVLIITAVLGLVVIMVGCGAGIAILNAKNANQASSDGLPSPTPAGTPSPNQQTSPTPVQGGSTATSSAETVSVPSGWVASTNNETITLTNPTGDGSVVISSGNDNPPQTPQQIKDVIDKELTTQFPDTAVCPNTKTTTGSIGGVAGIWWQLCFTATSGGQSLQGEFTLWVGANSDASVGYGVILFSRATRMTSFFSEAQPVLASIRWKLK